MLLLAAAVALGVAPAAVHADCMSLGGTTMCAHFQNSYIDPQILASDPPGAKSWGLNWNWLSNVNSASTFDQEFKKYLEGTGSSSSTFRGQVQDSLNCWSNAVGPNWGADAFPAENRTGPVFRYQVTALCSIMVGQPSSWACAEEMQGNLNTQQPACSDVCDSFAQSLRDVAGSSYWCKDNNRRPDQADTWKKWCNAPSNSSASCVEGSVNEGDNCGFGEWTAGLCEFCQGNGSGESCCASQSVQSACPGVAGGSSTSGTSTDPSSSATAGAGAAKGKSGSKGLSGGAIAGIVVGVVCGVLLLAALLGFLLWRRKKKSTKSQSLAAAPYEKFGDNTTQNVQSSPSVSPASMQDTAPLTGAGAGTGTESHVGRNAALGAAAGAGAGAAAMAAHHNRSAAPAPAAAAPASEPVATRTSPVTGTTAPVTNLANAPPAGGANPTTASATGPTGAVPATGPTTSAPMPSQGGVTAAGNFPRGPGIGAGTAAAAAVPAAAVGAGAGAAAAGSGPRPLPASPPRQAASPPPRPMSSSPVSPTSPVSSSGRSLPSPPGAGAALGVGALGAGALGAGAAAAAHHHHQQQPSASPFASPASPPRQPVSPPPSQPGSQFYNVQPTASGPAPGQFSSTPVGAVHSGPGHTATPLPAHGVAGMAGVGAGALAAARSQPGSAATTPNGSVIALPNTAPVAALAQAPAPSEAVASNANRQTRILDATGAYIVPGGYVTVMHPYAAQMPDELTLAPGMRLRVVDLFDDGWGTAVEVGRNGEGRRGQFPTVCVQAE